MNLALFKVKIEIIESRVRHMIFDLKSILEHKYPSKNLKTMGPHIKNEEIPRTFCSALIFKLSQ